MFTLQFIVYKFILELFKTFSLGLRTTELKENITKTVCQSTTNHCTYKASGKGN